MSLANAFAGIKAAREDSAQPATPVVKTSPPRSPLPLQGTAKSTHPEFAAVKIYLRKETRKLAERKYEDAGGGDFSDLVGMLLDQYLRT